MKRWEELTASERLAIQIACEESFPAFMRLAFWFVQGQELVWNWHHEYVCDELRKVYEGETNRLILNEAPGSTKTETFSIHFPAWCILRSIADNRSAKHRGEEELPGASTRWLPVSYSDELVKENTERVRSIIESEFFQAFWPVRPGKPYQMHNWRVHDEFDNQHVMYGTSLNGQVMGRRAGYMDAKRFTGALLIDDPLPTKDDGSFLRVDKANKQLNRILRSRLARNDVPILMMQQRITKGDSTDYLLGPKTPDQYRRVKVPAVCDREYVDSLPERTRERMVKATGFAGAPVSYWEWKEPLASLLSMKKADAYLYSSQYQQEPDEAALEGLIWRKEIARMVEEGRVLDRIPIEPALPVDTDWDLGMDDDMSIYLTQRRGLEIRLVGFYKNHDQGMEHYINWLHDFRDKFGIRFGEHYGPHDLAVRELMSGKSRLDTAKAMGLPIKLVERPQLKRDSIYATRAIFHRFWVGKENLATNVLAGFNGRDPDDTWPEGRGGWDAMKKYQREYDPDKEIFKPEPLHNWASHPNDALQSIGLRLKDKDSKKQQDDRRAMGGQSSGTWAST